MLREKISNNRYMRITALLGLVFMFQIKTFGQNFAEDFKAINKAYLRGDISFDIKYDYYNSVKNKMPDYFYKGNVKLKNGMVYYKMNGIEFSFDSVYTCILDHENKTIMIDTVRNKSNILSKINFIDSLTKVYKSISFSALDKNHSQYTIYSLLTGISHCEIIYNNSSKLIQKINIYFFDNRDGAKKGAIRNKLVITYSNINSNANNYPSTFKAQKFVSIKGKKISPLPAYNKYQIINNIN
jgi:hypothetical protein